MNYPHDYDAVSGQGIQESLGLSVGQTPPKTNISTGVSDIHTTLSYYAAPCNELELLPSLLGILHQQIIYLPVLLVNA